jgi:hypothetical protein
VSRSDTPVIVPLLTIVRRGAAERLRFFEEEFAGEPVRVIWDRRVSERRRLASPGIWRAGDRRNGHASSWDMLDFLIVESRGDGPAAAGSDAS